MHWQGLNILTSIHVLTHIDFLWSKMQFSIKFCNHFDFIILYSCEISAIISPIWFTFSVICCWATTTKKKKRKRKKVEIEREREREKEWVIHCRWCFVKKTSFDSLLHVSYMSHTQFVNVYCVLFNGISKYMHAHCVFYIQHYFCNLLLLWFFFQVNCFQWVLFGTNFRSLISLVFIRL